MSKPIEPYQTKARPGSSSIASVMAGNMTGEQRLYRFDNHYGASVVRGFGTYGAEQGLWELAVIKWYEGDQFELVYDTGITDDVMGHLSEDEVQETLRRIRDLPTASA